MIWICTHARHGLVAMLLVMSCLGVCKVVIADGCGGANGFKSDELAILHADVHAIGRSGVPGPVSVFGPEAFAVVAGAATGDVHEAVIAATHVGQGRVVAIGHAGILSREQLQRVDTAQFVFNAIRWTSGNPQRSVRHVRVGTLQSDAVADMLETELVSVTRLDRRDWHEHLKSFDVIVLDANHYQQPLQRAMLEHYLRAGGGMMTTSLGWGWMQLNPTLNLTEDHPGNQLLAKYGLMWVDGYLGATGPDNTYVVESPKPLIHVQHAMNAIAAHALGDEMLDRAEVDQASHVLLSAVRSVPEDDQFLRPRLEQLVKAHAHAIVPQAHAPIGLDQPLERVLIAREIDQWLRNPSIRRSPHPAAAVFPGDVDAEVDRRWHSVLLNPSVPDWQSTGYYLPPGGVVEVRVPPVLRDAGFRVRVGAHSDRNWHHANWQRIPEITIEQELTGELTQVGSPFGGLVYLVVPRNRVNAQDTATMVKLRGVVTAPRYVLGQTDVQQWQSTIRHAPAPWAELETSKLIITLPSSVIRELDDPTTVLEVWDRVMDACADLAMRPRERSRPERIVADQQISAGYMHAGYPIMTGLDVRERFIDVDALLAGEGAWGFYHEIGHNHQSSDWTFDGTVEVTVNLFTLYVMETICGMPPNVGHPALRPRTIHRTLVRYFDAGAPFDIWKQEPFLALAMYLQLRNAFGWEAFKAVFAEYRDLPAHERPRNDQAKRDQWMVRFATHVQRDLGPFFETWGVPTSREARESISMFQPWMPPDITRIHPE